jgi:transcriptional antiterminator RfaH
VAKEWHLIYTNPRKEELVVSQLQSYDLDVFFPVIEIERGHRRGIREEPLFPHYLFIRVDLSAGDLPNLRYLPGVRSLVHFGEKPVIVPDAVIDRLQDRLEAQQRRIPLADHLFKPGQAVRIRSGPFAGLDAVFQAGLKGTERAQILLDVLGSSTRVQVDANSLETL